MGCHRGRGVGCVIQFFADGLHCDRVRVAAAGAGEGMVGGNALCGVVRTSGAGDRIARGATGGAACEYQVNSGNGSSTDIEHARTDAGNHRGGKDGDGKDGDREACRQYEKFQCVIADDSGATISMIRDSVPAASVPTDAVQKDAPPATIWGFTAGGALLLLWMAAMMVQLARLGMALRCNVVLKRSGVDGG